MKVVFASSPAAGHVYPMLPLALAVRQAGHDVTFATASQAHSTLDQFGIRPEAAGIDFQTAFQAAFNESNADTREHAGDRREASPDDVLQMCSVKARVFGHLLPRAFFKDFLPLLERLAPALVIHEIGNPGAMLAARAASIPSVCHGIGRGGFFTKPLETAMRPFLDEFSAELGMRLPTDWPVGYGDPYLDIYPPSLQAAEVIELRGRTPLRPVGISSPGELPAIATRHKQRPLIYLTLGTVFGNTEILRCAVEGLAGLDADTLVATGPAVDPATLGPVPSNVHVEAWVPQARLLPKVDLVVHHGGSGTALSALSSAKPQLLLPQGADTPNNALALVAVGAGLSLDRDEVSAAAVAANAHCLLSDERYRAVARDLSDEIAGMPSPQQIVPLLERMAA